MLSTLLVEFPPASGTVDYQQPASLRCGCRCSCVETAWAASSLGGHLKTDVRLLEMLNLMTAWRGLEKSKAPV